MRTRNLKRNTISSLVFEMVTIICGFILPRLILSAYGSSVNGLVTSITQFLQIIAFLEIGVGAVVQSTLYKPLTEKDDKKISEIVVSANKFFHKLANILVMYIIILCFLYPLCLGGEGVPATTTIFLIIAIGISFFSQYYFGIVDRLLLTADQHGFIQYNTQTITTILNTLACALLIICGASIQSVKLITSLIYLIRPLYLRAYVNKYYKINRKITYVEEPIKQKKNGIAQHIASVVLNNTDTVVLTVFSSLNNVSVYSIYNMVIFGVKQLFTSMTNGVQALFGELWAKKELEELNYVFGIVEWIMHTIIIIIFGCTAVLIVPFVQVYTLNVHDANYIQPLFAVLITIAHAGHCLRLPYNIMILAAGHYKETQSNYILAAIMNLGISIIGVKACGLIGVALGTLFAMGYQTIWMAIYDSKHFLNRPFVIFVKQVVVDVIICVVASTVSCLLKSNVMTFFEWLVLAIQVFLIWCFASCFVNCILYHEKISVILERLKKEKKK